MPPEALTEVPVDARELQAIIQGHQHEGDHRVAWQIAQHHLQVAELVGRHHARHTDEGDSAERSADHAEGHDVPRRLPLTQKERAIARAL